MNPYDRLTALDASFLHMERPEYPMHVGAVSVFDGAPFFAADGRFRIDDVRDLVMSRLPLLPRFRRRLMSVPYEQGRPIWVDDDDFDITYHVRHTALPRPGSWEQLVALTTRVQEGLLDRDRPLWEIWFVEGLEGGNVAVLQKTHHALIDGVSGVDVATLLLDMSPDFPPPVVAEWTPCESASRSPRR
jgi:diacylglycerol O-acyltransferase